MEKTQTGTIRKIIVGIDPLKALAFEVGKEFQTPGGVLTVTEIIEDQNHFYFFGNIRFLVYAKKGSGNPVVWKHFDNMPVSVECAI